MILNARWPDILEDARLGDLAEARRGRQLDPAGALADYFYGRCLTEAGVEIDEAIACLKRAANAEPTNPAIIQTLALALARSGLPGSRTAAAEIWTKEGLPLDLDLLAQVSFTLESQLRPWPAAAPPELPWPAGLPVPGADPPAPPPDDGTTTSATEATDSQASALPPAILEDDDIKRDILAHYPATKPPGPLTRWRLGRAIIRLEDALMKDQPLKVLEMAGELLAKNLETPELHLVAGLAAEEAGLPDRARAHLSRAERLEPGMFLARTWLGRIYWRNGWFALAEALWRSIPVEGPYDYGRHYHLALAFDAQGKRPSALVAMRLSLDRFYFDTRHFYIKRALDLWQARACVGPENA